MMRGWMLSIAAAGLIGGCSQPAPIVTPPGPEFAVQPPGPVKVPTEPVKFNVVDGNLIREWVPSVAQYPNGSTEALPIYHGNLDAPTQEQWSASFVDVGTFLWNTLALPVRLIQTPPWRPAFYHGAEQRGPIPSASPEP